MKKCLRCWRGLPVIDAETGEMSCSNCGMVLSEKVEDSSPEWHSFSDGKVNRNRTGDGTSLARHDNGLSTIISSTNKDAAGKPLSTHMKSTAKRLRTWDNRSQTYSSVDKNLKQAFSELERLKDKLALSDVVIEKTSYIYRKALEKGLIRGRSISALIAAALYAACRDTEIPRTLKDIEEAGNIKRKEIARGYRLLHQELDLKMPLVDPIQCVSRIASKVGISEKIKRHAVKILKLAQEHEESAGKNPMALAATALYLSCVKNGDHVKQRDIAEAAGITEVTIRNRHKGLKLDQNIEL